MSREHVIRSRSQPHRSCWSALRWRLRCEGGAALARQDARLEQRFSAQDVKLEKGFAAQDARMAAHYSGFHRRMFTYWMGTVLALGGLYIALLRTR